jgi:hypothetical protein
MTSAGGPRVIFVDFGGVISTDEFWLSLRQDGHPLKARLDTGMQKIWHESPGISRAWMRGELSFAEVLAEMGLAGGNDFRRLTRDLGSTEEISHGYTTEL